jgi:hypothetical protein
MTSAKPANFLVSLQNAKRPEEMKLRVLSVGSGARRAPRGRRLTLERQELPSDWEGCCLQQNAKRPEEMKLRVKSGNES